MKLKYILLWMSVTAAIGALLAVVLRAGLIEVLIAWAVTVSIIPGVLKSRERKKVA